MFKNPLLTQRNFIKSLKSNKKKDYDDDSFKTYTAIINDTRPSDEKKEAESKKAGAIKKKRKRQAKDYVIFELDDK